METEISATIFHIQKFSIHDGPGIRTTVFFKGCNLRCGWCCNPEALLPEIQLVYDGEKCTGCGECVRSCLQGARSLVGGRIYYDREKCTNCISCIDACIHGALWHYGAEYTVDGLVAELLKDRAFYIHSGGGVTLSGGEVFLQADFAARLCDRLHEAGVHVAAETAAAVPARLFAQLLGKIDLWYIDFKHYDASIHKKATGVGNEQVIDNIRRVIDSGGEYMIRIPVIPGFNDALKDAACFADLFAAWGVPAVELMPFHQLGERKYAFLGMDYRFAEEKQRYKDDLAEYAQVFSDRKIHVI